MKPNQKNRYNGRYNNRNQRSMIMRNTALESSGPNGKLHGTALQLFEKYQAAAKDALIQNDLILAQTCLQYADHYMRIQNIAIMNEQNLRGQSQSSANVQKVSEETDVFETTSEETVEAAVEPVEKVQEKSVDEIPEINAEAPVENIQETKENNGANKGDNGQHPVQRRRTLKVRHNANKKSVAETDGVMPVNETPVDVSVNTEQKSKGPQVVVCRRGRPPKIAETPAVAGAE